MSILSWLFKTVVLDFLWDKGVGLISRLIEFLKERTVRQGIEDKNEDLAERVEAISAEISRLLREGKPVPAELKEKLREASRKLIRDSFRNGM